MMKRMRLDRVVVWTVCLMILAAATPSIAQEKIDETRDLNKNGTVKISNVSGSISVTGWDRGKVEIKGVLGKGTEKIKIEGDKERLEIRVIIPEHARNVEETILEIRVPEECRIDASGVSSDITVSQFKGRMNLEAVSGDVEAEGGREPIRIETVSGNIDLQSESQNVKAESVSGDISIRMVGGELDAETVSGDIDITGGEFTSTDLSTVSGDIQFNGVPKGDGSFSFDSHSGDLRISLSGKIDAEFTLSTFSGSIESNFGMSGRMSTESGPGKEISFTVGSGDADVEINTFSGDIRVTKK